MLEKKSPPKVCSSPLGVINHYPMWIVMEVSVKRRMLPWCILVWRPVCGWVSQSLWEPGFFCFKPCGWSFTSVVLIPVPPAILTKSKESIPLAFPGRKDSDATPMLSDSVDPDVEGIPSPSEPLVLGQDREEAYAGIWGALKGAFTGTGSNSNHTCKCDACTPWMWHGYQTVKKG